MCNYNQQLNILFKEWKLESEKHCERREIGEGGRVIFTEDGLLEKPDSRINVEKEWHLSQKRIMFILKDQPSDWCDDVRLWLINDPCICELPTRFIRNIANIFWGVYNTTADRPCSFADLQQAKANGEVKHCFCTKPLALVESKKQGGITRISNSILKRYLALYGNFLRKEIEILRPTIIICCGDIIYDWLSASYPQRQLVDGTPFSLLHSYYPSARKSEFDIYEKVMSAYRALIN